METGRDFPPATASAADEQGGMLRATGRGMSPELLLTIVIAIGLMAIVIVALDRNDRRR